MIVAIYYRVFFNWYIEKNIQTKKFKIVHISKCWINTAETENKLNEPLPF